MLMKVSIPVDAGNKAIKEGLLAKTVLDFVAQMKPEACYFGPDEGKRTAYFFLNLTDPSMMPSVSEPFFMNLNASIEMTPVMNLDDMKTGVERVLKK
jgi:hypothetical protein